MTRKKNQIGRKYKGQSGNPKQRAAKAASDDATASTGVNPAPMGRPWPTKEGGRAPPRLSLSLNCSLLLTAQRRGLRTWLWGRMPD